MIANRSLKISTIKCSNYSQTIKSWVTACYDFKNRFVKINHAHQLIVDKVASLSMTSKIYRRRKYLLGHSKHQAMSVKIAIDHHLVSGRQRKQEFHGQLKLSSKILMNQCIKFHSQKSVRSTGKTKRTCSSRNYLYRSC